MNVKKMTKIIFLTSYQKLKMRKTFNIVKKKKKSFINSSKMGTVEVFPENAKRENLLIK